MDNISFKSPFFIISIIIFFECLYSAEKKGRPRMPTPPPKSAITTTQKYIPYEKCNNHIYIEVMQPVKATPIGVRYFTRNQGCIPGDYFNIETITPLAHIRNNPYSCSVKRKLDGTSLVTFTYRSSSAIISAQASDTFLVHPEHNKQIAITKSGSDIIVAQFTVT